MMETQTQESAATSKRRSWRGAAVLSTALVLSVPALALSMVNSWANGWFAGPAIAASDDKVANGLRITDQDVISAEAGANPRSAGNQSGDAVLRDWQYTDGPSGGSGSGSGSGSGGGRGKTGSPGQ